MTPAWYRHDAARGTLTLAVHVQPNARASAFAGLHGEAMRIRVAAPAVDDKANAALLDFLRRELDLPAGALCIRRGAHSRHKVVEIAGAGPALVARLLSLVP